MPPVHEQLSEQFYRWELRGRGWQVYGEPVSPEPPFVPFNDHSLPRQAIVDDGRRPTLLSSLYRKLAGPPAAPPIIPEPEEECEPTPLIRSDLVELQTSLPTDLDVAKETLEQFLLNLSLCKEPICFELVGVPGRISVQFVASDHDAPSVRRQLQAYFPEASFVPRESTLEERWYTCSGEEELVVEFGLQREFMFSLTSGKLDPFVGIVGALSELQEGEFGLFQVLWQPVQKQWAESIISSVTHEDGKPFFVNAPELTQAAEKKVSKPLYAAVVRVATKAATFDRTMEIACDVAGSLRVFANPEGNELIPLENNLEEYSREEHVGDMLLRQSRRCGMMLNSEELIGFVHMPGTAVRSSVLVRDSGKTKVAPAIARSEHGLFLGKNLHLDESADIILTPEQRTRHVHIIGASGTGKSTLLFNLIRQDIESGQGVAVLDPHGDLVEKILGVIPEGRIQDVILVDPSDEEYSIGFNILSAHSDQEKTLLASDLVSVFQRLSTSWGDQMHSVLQNAILAFLNSSRGGTLADLRRFLVETGFRNDFLKSVSDPNVLYYWHKGFPHLSGNQSKGPVLTRLEMFLAQRPIALMVSQPANRLDFGQIMDTGKIFLAKLPEGLLGRENTYLLGALLVSKFQQLVMARQAKRVAARRDFWIYIDEFANFITPTMAEILSGARKYRIGLTLAHHELHQLQRNSEVASAVMAHPYTRVVFRVGDDDAKKLADGFSFFEPADLKNLEAGQAICRVERSNFDFNLSVPLPEMPNESAMTARQAAVIASSRQKYATPRAQVESMLRQAWEVDVEKSPAVKISPPLKPQPLERPAPSAPVAPPLVGLSIPAVEPQSVEKPKPNEPPIGSVEKTVPQNPIVTPPVNEPVIKAVTPSEPAEPRDLGKGGNQHRAIQQRIKKAAEELGFRANIEKPVLDGEGSADLWLERDGQHISCEISITNTIDNEVGKIIKCLKSGISSIAVICLYEQKLRNMEAAISGSLGPELATRVGYFYPDAFIAYLKKLPAEPPKDKTVIRKGYKIKHVVSKLSTADQKQKEAAAIRAIANSMRKKH